MTNKPNFEIEITAVVTSGTLESENAVYKEYNTIINKMVNLGGCDNTFIADHPAIKEEGATNPTFSSEEHLLLSAKYVAQIITSHIKSLPCQKYESLIAMKTPLGQIKGQMTGIKNVQTLSIKEFNRINDQIKRIKKDATIAVKIELDLVRVHAAVIDTLFSAEIKYNSLLQGHALTVKELTTIL